MPKETITITKVIEEIRPNPETHYDELVVIVRGSTANAEGGLRQSFVIKSGSASRMKLKALAERVFGESISIKVDTDRLKALAAETLDKTIKELKAREQVATPEA